MMNETMLTPEDVARRLGVCRRTVLVGELRARLPWVALSRRTLRLDPRALEAFVSGGAVA